MAAVFNHYADGLARYLMHGFSFTSSGQRLVFDGLRQRHDLHDVVAETFRRAFEERARRAYSGLSAYEGYLHTIARNILIDRLRSKSTRWVSIDSQTQPDSEQERSPAEPVDPGPTPERAFQKAEITLLLETFLNSLKPRERGFMDLRYRQGFSQELIASKMRKSRRWVRSLEVKLRRRLVKHLHRTGYLPGVARTSKTREVR